MWSGDWSQFPQESLRLLNSKVETRSYLEEARSLLFTLGNADDRDTHVVRVACLGPYLFASTYLSRNCEVWARSSGIYYHPSKLSDNILNPEVREVILVLDTLAYHICLLLFISTEKKGDLFGRLETKHQDLLKDFDKETVYYKIVALVEPSEFFKAFRKKLHTTILKDEQILGCFLITLKASIAHCSNNLDGVLTYIIKDSTDGDLATEGNQLKVSGNKKFKEGDHKEACRLYTEAIAKVRFNHLLYSNRALCSLQLNQYREVELDARRAIVLHPDFEKGYYKMAQVYESQKKRGHAKQVMEYYVKRCNLRVVNYSAEVKDLYEKLEKEAEQSNGKTDSKSSKGAPTKAKKKPVPGLVSDSDSEDPVPAKSAVNKSNIPQATLIKKASEDLLSGLYKSALNGYKEVLAAKPTMPEPELVILKYAAAHAAANLDSLEDLHEAEKWFLDITANHKDIIFPLAYHGLSLVNKRMNRFSDAQPYLDKGLSILSKGIRFNETVLWPGTKTKIDIAEREKLKKSLEEMQAECRSPPERDAMCCRDDCPLQKNIYYSDPDFRGFQQLHCLSKCLVQYHPACWKEIRDARNLTEKEFLGTLCPTPDCNVIIIKVETIEKDGTVGRQFVHSIFEKDTAPKQKKTKKEKKQELREMKKKQKRGETAVPTKQPAALEKEDDSTSVVSTGCDSVSSAFQDETITMAATPAAPSDAAKVARPQNKAPTAASARPDGQPNTEAATTNLVPPQYDAQYLLKREEENEDEVIDGRPKRWKKKRPKNVVTLDLGSNNHLYSEYQERIQKLAQYKTIIEDHGDWKTFCQKKKEMIPELDPEAPFFIPEALRNNEAALEAVLQHSVGFEDAENSSARENIYQYLHDLIQNHGPMPIQSQLLQDEVANFPPVARSLIDRAGGLQRFLMQSMRFFFINDSTVQTYGAWAHRTSMDDDSFEYPEEDYDDDGGEYVCEEEEELDGWSSTPSVTPTPVSVEQSPVSNLNPNALDFGVQKNPLTAALSGSGDCKAKPEVNMATVAFPQQESAADAVRPGVRSAGRELVVRQLLAGLAPRQLAECLVDAVQGFKGPLSPKMLSRVNKKLEFCRLSNNVLTRDYFVQVNLLQAAKENHEVDVKLCEELKLENMRLAEKLATALDQNVQLQRKNTLEANQSKEKLEEMSKELQVTKQALKKTKLESEAEVKKLQQEKMKLKEELKLIKSSREASDLKETLEKTITELAQLRYENGDLMENCKAFEEAADKAIDRARIAEVHILNTALEWGKERRDRAAKTVDKALKDLDHCLSLSSEPPYTAELTKLKGLTEKYQMEWSNAFKEFERKVKLHVEKVEAGEPLASLPFLNIPSRPDFNIRIPPPQPQFLVREPFSFPVPAPPVQLYTAHGPLSRPRLPGHFRPSPGVVPHMAPLLPTPRVNIPNGTIPRTMTDQPCPPLSGPPPGLGRFPGMSGPHSSVGSSRGSSPGSEGFPAAAAGAQSASRFAKTETSAAAGTGVARSEKLFAKLSSKYPNHSEEEIKAALQKVYKELNGLKGMTIAQIIKATSNVIENISAAASTNAPSVSVVRMSRVRGTLKDMSQNSAKTSVDAQQRQLQRSWAPAGAAANGLVAMRWNGTNSQCSICLEDVDGTSKQMQTSCGHSFHEHCLEKWYKTDKSCPNCRTLSLSDKDFPRLEK